MGDIQTALAIASGLLFAAALGLITLTHKEMRGARIALAFGTFAIFVQQSMWSFTTDAPWGVRALIGAIFGAMILAGVPALWHLSYERERHGSEQPTRAPNISFQKLSIFQVEIAPDIYQTGVVVKLFNLESKPYLINAIGFLGRATYAGNFWLQQAFVNTEKPEFIEDNYIKPYSDGYYKWAMPLKNGMKWQDGAPAPGLVFIGPWVITLGEQQITVTPELYANYDRAISPQEWADLLKISSKIKLDDMQYKETPIAPDTGDGQVHNYFLFNPDSTAKIDVWSFSPTQRITGSVGVMLALRGIGHFQPQGAWTIWGETYPQIWSDPKKLAIYNSLFPPDKDGRPRPFGFFAGAEGEMMRP